MIPHRSLRPIRSSPLRYLLGFAAFVVAVAGLKAAAVLVVPLLLATVLAVLCAPVLQALQARRVPTGLGVGLVVIGIVGVGVIVASVVGASLNGFVGRLPEYRASLQVELGQAVEWATRRGLPVDREAVMDTLDPSAVMTYAAGLVGAVGQILGRSFLIVLVTVFILLELGGLPSKLRAASDDPDRSFRYARRFIGLVKHYLVIKTAVSAATGLAVGVGLALIGVDFAPLWGLLAFLLNFIPTIGSLVAAVPAVLLAYVQGGFGLALAAMLMCGTVNVALGNVLEPRILGRRVGLSPLVVVLSLLVWGYVLGPVGMLLAVPLTMVAKLAMEASPELEWIAVLLGPERGLASSRVPTAPELAVSDPVQGVAPRPIVRSSKLADEIV